ncbi:hypothetical protein LLG46_14540 [bacterium]|nr:hypothetical protein [bacterium]
MMNKSVADVITNVAHRSTRRGTLLLFAVFLCGGIIYSLVLPLGLSPDEAAHVKYIKYMARTGSLPIWKPDGGGEAGYESQHPPLMYATGAVVYRASSFLPENWRWQILRWYSLLIGVCLFWVARGFFLDYFKDHNELALVPLAALSVTPLVLEYSSYPNPDIMCALWSTLAFWMAMRVARGTARRSDQVILSIALGLGLLTKLTALSMVPVVVLAYIFAPAAEASKRWEKCRLGIFGTFLAAMILAGWWYYRNGLLYHVVFPHTISSVLPGWPLLLVSGKAGLLIWTTLFGTFGSSFVELGWMPFPLITLLLCGVVFCVIVAAVLTSLRRHSAKRRSACDPAHWLMGVLIMSIFVSQQYQAWFIDFAFSFGGRYMMSGLACSYGLIAFSLAENKRRRLYYGLWIGALLTMGALSVAYLVLSHNMVVVPGWHLLKLTIPY